MEAEPYQEVVWKHKKTGHYYNIKAFSLREMDLAPQIVYQRQFDVGPCFIRPAEEFFDGRFIIAEPGEQ